MVLRWSYEDSLHLIIRSLWCTLIDSLPIRYPLLAFLFLLAGHIRRERTASKQLSPRATEFFLIHQKQKQKSLWDRLLTNADYGGGQRWISTSSLRSSINILQHWKNNPLRAGMKLYICCNNHAPRFRGIISKKTNVVIVVVTLCWFSISFSCFVRAANDGLASAWFCQQFIIIWYLRRIKQIMTVVSTFFASPSLERIVDCTWFLWGAVEPCYY